MAVMVVDDNADGAESLAELLRSEGLEVRVAHDGAAALALAEAWRPRAMLVDIGMPGMRGHEVARQLRAEAWGRRMLLVALTGWSRTEDRRQSSEAGFDEHLVKPVNLDRLLALLAAG